MSQLEGGTPITVKQFLTQLNASVPKKEQANTLVFLKANGTPGGGKNYRVAFVKVGPTLEMRFVELP